MSALESQYRRLLRWYPKQWRARNEAAVTGALLDEAEDQGRMSPTVGDRASLVLGGLHERFLRAERPTVVTVAGFGVAAAFALWYAFIITWSPSIPAYAGTFSSFSNPALTTGLIYLVALALTLGRRLQLARITALAGVLCAIVLFALNLTLGWLGPGASATALLVGVGVLAALSLTRWRDLVAAGSAVILATISATAARTAVMYLDIFYAPPFWIAALITIVTGAAAVLIVAIAVVRREVGYAARQ